MVTVRCYSAISQCSLNKIMRLIQETLLMNYIICSFRQVATKVKEYLPKVGASDNIKSKQVLDLDLSTVRRNSCVSLKSRLHHPEGGWVNPDKCGPSSKFWHLHLSKWEFQFFLACNYPIDSLIEIGDHSIQVMWPVVKFIGHKYHGIGATSCRTR